MASFTDKPKIPLLGNSGSETYASFGTWKGSFSSALVRHGCGVYSSLDVSELPVAFPTDPKQATSSTTQQRYEETVAMFEGKFKISNKWELEGKSEQAYALLHEAVAKNPKLTGLIEKPDLKGNFIAAFAAIEAAIVDDSDEAARELKEQVLDKLKQGHTPDQIRDAIDFAECSNGHLRTVVSGSHFLDDKALFDALKVSLKRMAELPRFNLLSTTYGLTRMEDGSLGTWEKTIKFVKTQVPLNTASTSSQPTVPTRTTALTAQQRSARQPFVPRPVVCFKCGGPHRALGDSQRGIPACSVKCFCTTCQEDSHSTEYHDMFTRIVGKHKAKKTDTEESGAKAMSATTTCTETGSGQAFCLSAQYSHAQDTEPGSYPLELVDSPEPKTPERKAIDCGYERVGNSLLTVDYSKCYPCKPINTAGKSFMTPGSLRFPLLQPGTVPSLVLNLRAPSVDETSSMKGDSILVSQVKSKLFRVGRLRHNARFTSINSMYEYQMTNAHKDVILKKGHLT